MTRRWATPLTIASFFLMASTGVLMFFEIDGGLVAVAHQWCSWLFIVGAAGHVVANVRAFEKHLSTWAGRGAIAAFAAVLLTSLFPGDASPAHS